MSKDNDGPRWEAEMEAEETSNQTRTREHSVHAEDRATDQC